MQKIKGKKICGGIDEGIIRVFSDKDCESDLKTNNDSLAEIERFFAAKSRAKKICDDLYKKSVSNDLKEAAEVVLAQKTILDDEEFDKAVTGMIEKDKIPAERAVSLIRDEFCELFKKSDDEKLIARSYDVYEISDILTEVLSEDDEAKEEADKGEKIIIASKNLSTSLIIKTGRENIAGLVSESDGKNSHAAIIAGSLGIPTITGCSINELSAFDERNAIIDAYEGELIIEPDEDTRNGIIEKMTERGNGMSNEDQMDLKDCSNLKILANIGSVADIDNALSSGADGVGLFRTEFIFMDTYDYPTLEEQYEKYKEAAEKMNGRELIIRTADIGGDKKVPYMTMLSEGNPALGLKGIRRSLSEPEMFKTQLKAILMASASGKISIMFPMITSVNEVTKAKGYLEEVKEELRNKKISFDENIRVGVMIETPAAVMIADELAKEVDFFSVGTNDLTQYTLAADRCNAEVDDYYDPHHPAIIKMLKAVAEAGKRSGIKTGICGELGSDISMIKTFSDMGYDSISVSLAKLPVITGALKGR